MGGKPHLCSRVSPSTGKCVCTNASLFNQFSAGIGCVNTNSLKKADFLLLS